MAKKSSKDKVQLNSLSKQMKKLAVPIDQLSKTASLLNAQVLYVMDTLKLPELPADPLAGFWKSVHGKVEHDLAPIHDFESSRERKLIDAYPEFQQLIELEARVSKIAQRLSLCIREAKELQALKRI